MGLALASRNPWLRLRSRPSAGARDVFELTGTAKSASGAPIAGATVFLFDFGTNALVSTTTSDGSGNYVFNPPTNGPYWTRFYLASAPEIFGTSGQLIPWATANR